MAAVLLERLVAEVGLSGYAVALELYGVFAAELKFTFQFSIVRIVFLKMSQ